jgi:hypothetical protein
MSDENRICAHPNCQIKAALSNHIEKEDSSTKFCMYHYLEMRKSKVQQKGICRHEDCKEKTEEYEKKTSTGNRICHSSWCKNHMKEKHKEYKINYRANIKKRKSEGILTCSHHGCTNPYHALGKCKKHYDEHRKGVEEDRIADKVHSAIYDLKSELYEKSRANKKLEIVIAAMKKKEEEHHLQQLLDKEISYPTEDELKTAGDYNELNTEYHLAQHKIAELEEKITELSQVKEKKPEKYLLF